MGINYKKEMDWGNASYINIPKFAFPNMSHYIADR